MQRFQASKNGSNGQLHVRKKLGRPTLRTNRIETVLLGRLASGHSLNSICKRKRMPCYSTVMSWALNEPDFLEKYNAARSIQAEKMIDEILDIADDGTNDYISRTVRGKEVEMFDAEHVQRSKLRVEARLKIAGKLLPKKYGDKGNEVHVSSTVNNFVIVNEDQLKKLQMRNQEALR